MVPWLRNLASHLRVFVAMTFFTMRFVAKCTPCRGSLPSSMTQLFSWCVLMRAAATQAFMLPILSLNLYYSSLLTILRCSLVLLFRDALAPILSFESTQSDKRLLMLVLTVHNRHAHFLTHSHHHRRSAEKAFSVCLVLAIMLRKIPVSVPIRDAFRANWTFIP